MNVVYLVFLALAWVGIECFIGGTRLIYSLPAYGVVSIAALISIASIRGKRTPPNASCLGSTLLLGAWILVRAAHSPVEYLAWPDFFMMLACLMTYLLTAFYLTGVRERTALIAVLWSIAAVELWVAMIQFARDQKFMLFGLMRPLGSGVNRPSGMYISPNNLAGFLVTVAILSLSLGVWSRWRVWVKMLAIYIAALCLIGVAISGSRGGYFATIGSLLAFAIVSIYAVRATDPRKSLPTALWALAGLAATVALAVFLMGHSELLTHRMQTMAAKDVRIYNWAAAIDHIRFSPWVGTGAGTHLIYGRLFRRLEIQSDPVHAHCDYLELVAEYGLVGALCMGLFLFAHIRKAIASLSDILRQNLIPSGMLASDDFAIQLGVFCAVVGLAIHSVVDFDMHIPGNALIFAFLFGVIANPGMDRTPGFAECHLTPWARLLLPALGLFTLWRGMQMIPSEYCAEMARRSLRNNALMDSITAAKKGIGPAASGIGPDLSGTPPDILDKLLARTGANPKNPNLYLYLGEANRMLAMRLPNPFLRNDYLGRAATAYERGLKLFPQNETMLVRSGQVMDALRRFGEAEDFYQKALAWDPNLLVIRDYYEKHLTAEGKKAEADAMALKWQAPKVSISDTEPRSDLSSW